MLAERRNAPRVRFEAKVTLVRSDNSYVQTVGCNLSVGGIAVRTQQQLYNGEPLQVLFAVRDPDTGVSREFSLHAEVSYIVRVTNPVPANMMGLKFISCGASDERFLSDYIAKAVASLRATAGVFPNFNPT
jgi:c-di-GMP-binding flagellar brake protein YcgR